MESLYNTEECSSEVGRDARLVSDTYVGKCGGEVVKASSYRLSSMSSAVKSSVPPLPLFFSSPITHSTHDHPIAHLDLSCYLGDDVLGTGCVPHCTAYSLPLSPILSPHHVQCTHPEIGNAVLSASAYFSIRVIRSKVLESLVIDAFGEVAIFDQVGCVEQGREVRKVSAAMRGWCSPRD